MAYLQMAWFQSEPWKLVAADSPFSNDEAKLKITKQSEDQSRDRNKKKACKQERKLKIILASTKSGEIEIKTWIN